MAIRWRWPPERRTPFSPRKVARPCGSASRNSRACRRLGRGAAPRRRWPPAGRSGCWSRRRPRRSPAPAARGRCARGTPRGSRPRPAAGRRAGRGRLSGRRSAAAAGTRWSCRPPKGRPAPPSRRAAPRARCRPAPGGRGATDRRSRRPRSAHRPGLRAGSGSGTAGARDRRARSSSSSNSRSVAPAARCRSPNTSLRPPTALATMVAKKTNEDSSPALMPPGQHVLAADPEHDDDGAEHQGDDDRPQGRPWPGACAAAAAKACSAVPAKRAALARLLRERLHGADRVQRLLGRGADARRCGPGRPATGRAPAGRG